MRYQNAVRFDVGGIVAGTVASTALGGSSLIFPLLASYERQLKPRFSVVAEGLLNGGDDYERKAGVSLQSRYYVRPRCGSSLAGFYATPALAYRVVRLRSDYAPEVRRRFVGAGVLVGWQGARKADSRWFWDVSAGIMRWQKTGADKVAAPAYGAFPTSSKAYYETHRSDFDGRLGVGYRF
ncbi:hypothetical protein [Hymenobacter rubripertinctus]|uniref:DUF3575 domain-containing protein n=1 Tax=Hymenobacter rubripertinctus TaxID=2029981 RepID=A0A418QS04_9BACT|nr:hypothetical protein [Hymenobacter rubripertinctus]RIY07800.1 hypothetical protein D0T11_15605 [Hymenobacter rubripertinctus]